jgi:hypothetical protein
MILRDNYFDARQDDLRKMLGGRKWAAIKDRAYRLGIHRDRRIAQKHATNPKRDAVKAENERRVLTFIIDFHKQMGSGPLQSQVTAGLGQPHETVKNATDRLLERGLLIKAPGRVSPLCLAPSLRRRVELRAREMTAA